jgi:hypothetical protein
MGEQMEEYVEISPGRECSKEYINDIVNIYRGVREIIQQIPDMDTLMPDVLEYELENLHTQCDADHANDRQYWEDEDYRADCYEEYEENYDDENLQCGNDPFDWIEGILDYLHFAYIGFENELCCGAQIYLIEDL